MIWEAKAASHTRRICNVNYLLCSCWCAPCHETPTEATQCPWHGALQRWPWLSSLCISCKFCCPRCSTTRSWWFMYFSPKAVLGPPPAAFSPCLCPRSFSYNSLFCRHAEGFARCGSGLRCGSSAGRMPSVLSSVTSMKGRLKSGHHIFLSFCYISVNLKKFE